MRLALLFLLVCFVAQSQESVHGQTHSQNKPEQSSSQTAPTESPVNQSRVENVSSPIQQPKGESEQAKPVTRAEKIQIGINVLLFFVILWQTVIYIQQRNTMRTQVNIARIAERAYLSVGQIGMSELVIGEVPVINATVENGGRTPAFKIRAPGSITLEPAGKRPEIEVIKSRFITDEAILAAGKTRTAVYEFGALCDALMKHAIESGEVAVFIQITIWYEDVWGNVYSTPVFLEWNPVQSAFMDRRERQHGDASQQNPT